MTKITSVAHIKRLRRITVYTGAVCWRIIGRQGILLGLKQRLQGFFLTAHKRTAPLTHAFLHL